MPAGKPSRLVVLNSVDSIAPLAGSQLSDGLLAGLQKTLSAGRFTAALPCVTTNCTAEYSVSSTANGAASRKPEYEVPLRSGHPEGAFRSLITFAVPVLKAALSSAYNA